LPSSNISQQVELSGIILVLAESNQRDSTLIMRALILTGLLGFATLSGCTFPGVYKLNVQQGNIVTPEMLSQLKPGMNQRQVSYVMGNPVMRNPFEQKQWDYIYTLEQRDKVVKDYHVIIHFNDQGLYTHYSGDLPAEDFNETNQLNSLPEEERNLNTVPTDL
jgi:outer membrane protein assembly factor BamE